MPSLTVTGIAMSLRGTSESRSTGCDGSSGSSTVNADRVNSTVSDCETSSSYSVTWALPCLSGLTVPTVLVAAPTPSVTVSSVVSVSSGAKTRR